MLECVNTRERGVEMDTLPATNRYEKIEAAARDASALLKAMSNERRLIILCHLAKGEHSVGQLCERVGVSQSALSQHLAKLRHDSIVTTRREAQTIYYSLNGGTAKQVLDTLFDLYCGPALEAD
jgi:DNA-binding transcriptional ArsR family regulator